MKKKIKRPIFDAEGYEEDFDGVNAEDLVTVKDHRLPSPAEIAKSLKNSRVTILLEDDIIAFFKNQAIKHHVSYQQMIREVLRKYMEEVKRAA